MGKDESRDGAAGSLRVRFGWDVEGRRRAGDGVICRIRALEGDGVLVERARRKEKKGKWSVSCWSRGEVQESQEGEQEARGRASEES